MTTSRIQMDQIRSTSATVTGENILAGSQKKSSLSPAEGLQGASPDATCTCPSGDGSLRHPCPAHPAVEQAGGDERDFQAKGAQEVPSPVSKEYDRHLIGLLRKGEALPGHQEEAADEIERLRDWNDHLNNTVLPNILNPNFLMLMKGGERLLDLCTKDGKFIGVSLNDMKDVFDWMVTHARIAPDHAALAQPSPASDLDPLNLAPHAEAFNEAPDEALRPEQAEAERSALWAVHAQGPDELYAAFSREDAEKHAAELNALPMPEGIAVGAVVVPSPWPAVQHWQYLAEQEQDHKNEIAGRLRQHERIGEALRAEITQLRQHKNDYMDAGQETYRALQNEIREREAEIARLDGLVSGHTAERDAALARVAELEKQEPVATIAKVPGEDWNGLHFYRDLQGMQPGTKLYAAPVAQAQPEETPGEILAAKLIETWVTKHGKPAPWSTAVEITALATNMPNDERDRLLALDDDVDAQAQHSVPEGWMLVECGIWTQEQVDEMQKTVARFRNSEFVDDRALAMAVADAGQCKAPEISLAELLAAAPGKEGL
ncbi:hypothetical protein ACM8BP_04285 [Pseudomonas aeruginosa]|uniref:hypothetical protein n=1 Tax=Pseudomonas aeruginosa TaxID=287 RepID=UPI001AD99E41|nr:hypothetical protein [Pseudomonas aeruginosa]MDY1135980.1 hypothetical protein [Pseudomonas aeruginosa]